MRRPALVDRFRYAFDNSLSGGALPLMGWLAIASVALVLVSALFLWLLGVSPFARFVDLTWMLTLYTLGKSIPQGDGAGWPYLLSMLVINYGGVFVTGTLIAILTEMVRDKIAQLREGRSRVIESGHTVILGWSSHTLVLIRELATAKADDRDSCVVVLADRDKSVMDADIHAGLPELGRTRVVCRRGNPGSPVDLATANLEGACSIVVPSPEGDDPDAEVIRILLAVKLACQGGTSHARVVAEIKKPSNLAVARLAGEKTIELVWAGDLISRITAQACREPGLSTVYTELLDFKGDEMYFRAEPWLSGKTFADTLLAYEESTVIGVLPSGGTPRLKPPMETVLGDGDQLIVIAEDDSTIRPSDRRAWDIRADSIVRTRSTEAVPEKILVLGWNWLGASIINELDHYAAPGSVVTVVSDLARTEDDIRRHCRSLANQSVEYFPASTTDRSSLEEVGVADYSHVIVLSYCDSVDRRSADARTLVTLLHLREFSERTGHPFSIVSEMLDVRNRDLAETARADDFIVSEEFVSLALAQISERSELAAVFADLFDPDGSEIHMRPAGDYVVLDQPIDFFTVVESARQRGEVAVGYCQRARSTDPGRSYGVKLNPVKSASVTYAEADRIIVIAEA